MDYLRRGYELDVLHLSTDVCPLSEKKQKAAIVRKRQHMARHLVALATKGRSPGLALRLRKQIKLSWGEMVTGLRGYQS